MKLNYEEPRVEGLEVELEAGIAQSGGNTGGGGDIPGLGDGGTEEW